MIVFRALLKGKKKRRDDNCFELISGRNEVDTPLDQDLYSQKQLMNGR